MIRLEREFCKMLSKGKVLKVLLIFAGCALAMGISASALTVIDGMDNGKLYSAQTEKDDIKEGEGAVSLTGASGTIVLGRKLDDPIDLSAYAGTGYVRLYLYIESVANMSDTSGQFELTSSGTCDIEETSWNLAKNMLVDGWNMLVLPLESPGENAADLSKINYIRVYIHITGQNRVMLDGLAAGTEEEFGVEVKSVETSEPVKTPEEVYGEGGAVAAATATPPTTDDSAETDVPMTSGGSAAGGGTASESAAGEEASVSENDGGESSGEGGLFRNPDRRGRYSRYRYRGFGGVDRRHIKKEKARKVE